VFEVEVKAVAMQKALLAAASRTALFSHFGGGAAGAAVSVKLQNGESRVRWQGMVTKAGQQVEQAGEDPKVEVSSSDEAYRFAPCSHYKRVW
jgi:adenosylcobinamide amidohydrolase